MKNISLVLFLFVLTGCNNQESLNIISGDLVFIGNSNSTLSSAIDNVTKTKANTSYSHMGIIEVIDDIIYVIHSNSYNGVCKEPLNIFKSRNGSISDSLYIYRLSGNYDIENTLKIANQELGKSYNNSYIIEDEGYYCSEFIYFIFKEDSVFTLNPMTFKNPTTGEFNVTWIEHYKELGVEIPEGKLGCNPNEMSQNKNLKLVTKL